MQLDQAVLRFGCVEEVLILRVYTQQIALRYFSITNCIFYFSLYVCSKKSSSVFIINYQHLALTKLDLSSGMQAKLGVSAASMFFFNSNTGLLSPNGQALSLNFKSQSHLDLSTYTMPWA